MLASADPQRGGRRLVYAAFVTLAILAGPVSGYSSGAILAATQLRVFTALAWSSFLAGASLVGYTLFRRHVSPDRRQIAALVLLLVPQWCALPFSSLANPISWLHGLGWGTALLISLAAPLWLALVAALDVLPVEVPRQVVAAAIVSIGVIYLVLPVQADTVTWKQLPMLLLQVILGVAMVSSWVIAKRRLEVLSTASAAGWYLLLSSLGDLSFALVYERTSPTSIEWRSAVLPVLCEGALYAAMFGLWFWLLQQMPLAAFSMRALAAWVASILPGFVLYGFMEWRQDTALLISLSALVIALRAHAADEQPLALGLSSG